jgi:ABC-type antimicrobial peptide transport system permease subunit
MFKNYLLVALRNLVKHKAYSIINIISLAIGIAFCILIALWVQDELSFDDYHKNADNIYRVVMEEKLHSDGPLEAMSPMPLAPTITEDYSGVRHSARLVFTERMLFKYDDNIFHGSRVCYTSPEILKMFDFPVVQGNTEAIYTDPYTIAITEKAARQYFGADNPIGKTIIGNNEHNFTVAAVLKDIPRNSHIQFDFLIPFAFLQNLGRDLNYWGDVSYYTYVLLKDGCDLQIANEMINACVNKHDEDRDIVYRLQPLKNVHLYSSYLGWDIGGHGNILYIYIFSALALFVLVIACANFINLTTARSSVRFKEIAMRKVFGAERSHIIRQFYGESILFTFLSFGIAIIIVELILPMFNDLAGKELTLISSANAANIIILAGIILVTGFLGGSYPALYLSLFHPIRLFKGSSKSGNTGSILRSCLVILQFVISIVLIFGTLIVFNQMRFINSKNLGFDKDQILYLKIDQNLRENLAALKTELLREPDIVNATAAASPLTVGYLGSTSGFTWEGKPDNKHVEMNLVSIDYDFFRTFDMELTAGREFSPDFARDTMNVILNEAAVRAMEIDSPVGKKFVTWISEGEIIGIVKDYNYKSLHTEIEPLVLVYEPDYIRYLFVKIRPGNIHNTIAMIKNACNRFTSDFPIECRFLDDEYDALYRTEHRVGSILKYGAIMAIIISCLGLLGLVSYSTELRTKEIGIRKVLGASGKSIIWLLSGRFLTLLVIANMIAMPIG